MRTLISLFLTCLIIAPLTVHAAGSSSNDSNSSESNSTSYEYNSYGMRMAASYIEEENFLKAIAQLQKEVSRKPDNADAWNLLGFSLRKQGEYGAAETAYEKALSIDPKHTGAMEYMGELYLTLNMPEKSKSLLADLNRLCAFNCKDRDTLKAAIAAYEAKN